MKGDMNTIEELMKILQEKKLTEISLETSEIKINIKGSLIPEEKVKTTPKKDVKKVEEKKNISNCKDIVSEHIGRFNYLKKDGTPKLTVGQEIKEGQELGDVVAVGVALPIVAKFSGVIEEIYVKSGDPVDYGRPLIKVKIS
ncbi:biotin/lipoyl-containing protein [uncultured Fusobacterium sp.]|uniref:acetyl-CoA carboxylase biotin carboxyl carrier protein n=1 Tax=uncultured Fusobacterium sp. TaxID=159267 RepID=UPI0025F418A7|nr:biotin/lipoyl-containing protein [uncultured Fusobacterium sp.]